MAKALQRGKIGSRSLNKLLGGTKLAAAVAAGTGVSATTGVGSIQKTVIDFADSVFALVDGVGVVAYTSKKVLDFPQGSIEILGATLDLQITKSSAGVNDTFDGDVSVGTVAAAGDATLTSTEANVVPSTPIPQAVAGAAAAKARSTAAVLLDGTTTAVDLYLNLLVDDADHDVTTTPANLIVNGTLTVLWANYGDY